MAGLSSDHIQVRPVEGATVSSLLTVSGWASAYEGDILVEPRDNTGRRLFSGHGQAGFPDLARFEARFTLGAPTTRGVRVIRR